jgi:hypothetical protein
VVEAVEPISLSRRAESEVDVAADLVGVAAVAIVDVAQQVDAVTRSRVLLERRVGIVRL